MPAATVSSMAHWTKGLSTMGRSSRSIILFAGKKRVPNPVTENTALRIFLAFNPLSCVLALYIDLKGGRLQLGRLCLGYKSIKNITIGHEPWRTFIIILSEYSHCIVWNSTKVCTFCAKNRLATVGMWASYLNLTISLLKYNDIFWTRPVWKHTKWLTLVIDHLKSRYV